VIRASPGTPPAKIALSVAWLGLRWPGVGGETRANRNPPAD